MGKFTDGLKTLNKYNPLNPKSVASPIRAVKEAGGLVKDVAGAVSAEHKRKKMFDKLIETSTDKQYKKEGWGQVGSGKVPEFFRGDNQTSKGIRDKMLKRYKSLDN